MLEFPVVRLSFRTLGGHFVSSYFAERAISAVEVFLLENALSTLREALTYMHAYVAVYNLVFVEV